MMTTANDNEKFRTREYWDARFANEDEYDWLGTYSAYRDLLRRMVDPSSQLKGPGCQICPPTQSILVLGCGNSSLSARMYEDGFTHIVNIDYSDVVVQRMRTKYAHLTQMTWHTMDMRALTFANESFDVVLEKGTLDALFAEKNADPWNPSAELRTLLDESLQCVSRVLRHGGRFISISFGEPFFRRPLLLRAKYAWDLQVESVGEAFHYHVYSMCKGSPDAPNEDAPAASTSVTIEPGIASDQPANNSTADDNPFEGIDI